MVITAKASVRIDFGGAWTDVDRYAAVHGGVVFNATIDQYVMGTLQTRVLGDGAQAREGLSVQYGFELPTGSGLGTSAALNVCLCALIGRPAPSALDTEARRLIAEQAFGMEALLGILGGRQDQYAAAFGGFRRLRFSGGAAVEVDAVAVSHATQAALQRRSVLCYTGKSRLSGSIHESVWGAFDAGRPETVAALHRLQSLGELLPATLEAGDIDGFAAGLAENWCCQKALDPSVTNPQIDALFLAATRSGALGGKACGAGGGGCLYFVVADGQVPAVASALAAAGAQVLPFAFESAGLIRRIEEENQ